MSFEIFTLRNYTGKESQEFKSMHCCCVVQYCEMEPEFYRTRMSRCIGDRALQKYDNLVASQILQRRKIRVIEGNAKCRHPKKLTCKVTFRPVFICLRPRTPTPPPPYTLYITFIRYAYSHREGGRGESWTREKIRGVTIHRAGSKIPT